MSLRIDAIAQRLLQFLDGADQDSRVEVVVGKNLFGFVATPGDHVVLEWLK